jgi:hypothetical protein
MHPSQSKVVRAYVAKGTGSFKRGKALSGVVAQKGPLDTICRAA